MVKRAMKQKRWSKKDTSTDKKNRYIYVNNGYLMANGSFVDNPFYKQYKMTRIVGYLMGNPVKSKNMIKRLVASSGYRKYKGQVIDDIYGYALDFHSAKNERDFRPNYHNSSDYRIEQYIEIALHQAVNSYNRKMLLNKKTRETNIDDDPDTKHTISSRSFTAVELETSRSELGYFYECFDYLMAIVGNTKPLKKKITPVMVYDIFLSGFDRVSVRRQISRKEAYYEMDESYYTYINKTYKLTERQVVAWINRIKTSEDSEPFVEMVRELVLPIKEGNFMREDIETFEYTE